MTESSIIQTVLVYALPVLFAITLHEAAHGFAAKQFGDQTAYRLGRVSLNPLRHIDPVGTVLLPAMILLTSSLAGAPPFLFGWAKPVPIDSRHLRNPRVDAMWISAAGPLSNIAMMLGWTALLRIFNDSGFDEPFFIEMAIAGIGVNIVLAALNLLPLPPLDGSKIVAGFLSPQRAFQYLQLGRWGFPILLLLMVTGLLSLLMAPIMYPLQFLVEFLL